ncbi:MAG: DUF503 domain-containing protein [Gammaproteobacteria bacterium]|nr:DUF503 domain-containing protein [Gammaproteobacteria bacterium]
MSAKATAHVVLLTFDLMIPFSHSLKDKRRVIKGLKDRVRARFNAAVAEIGYLEEWQRSLIGVALLGNDPGHLEQGSSAIGRLIEETADIQLLKADQEWL